MPVCGINGADGLSCQSEAEGRNACRGKGGLELRKKSKEHAWCLGGTLIRRWHGIPPDILIRGGEALQRAG
jgi:hypothetical protein